MDLEFIKWLIGVIIACVFGTGGLLSFIITIIKLNKKASKYVTRCELASDFIKKDVVKVSPPEARQILIEILDGTIDNKKEKNKAVKEAKNKDK